MPQAHYVQVKGEDKLIDEVNPGNKDYQRISIGNCVVYFVRDTKGVCFSVSGDDVWPFEAASRFRRILEYIETVYGS